MSLFSVTSPNPPTSSNCLNIVYSLRLRQWFIGLLFGIVIGAIIASAGGTALLINYMEPYRAALIAPNIQYQNEKAEVNSQLRNAAGQMIELK
ncbi:MAG: hypothetical protein V3V99_10325 [candidate division Zixibacteria bacterium]